MSTNHRNGTILTRIAELPKNLDCWGLVMLLTDLAVYYFL